MKFEVENQSLSQHHISIVYKNIIKFKVHYILSQNFVIDIQSKERVKKRMKYCDLEINIQIIFFTFTWSIVVSLSYLRVFVRQETVGPTDKAS